MHIHVVEVDGEPDADLDGFLATVLEASAVFCPPAAVLGFGEGAAVGFLRMPKSAPSLFFLLGFGGGIDVGAERLTPAAAVAGGEVSVGDALAAVLFCGGSGDIAGGETAEDCVLYGVAWPVRFLACPF